MKVLPSGSRALLLELDSQADVLALYAGLQAESLSGVIDLVPAARTILVVTDGVVPLAAVACAVQAVTPRRSSPQGNGQVTIPVHYDGADLAEVARLMGCSTAEVIRRHGEAAWTVAFCGFAPGFGYLTSDRGAWDIPRRPSPRTTVPAGSVALAGEYSAVYPRRSPGGWRLIGHTEVDVFDLHRDPAALLRPGVRVRFVDVGE